jgi:hypothetical protein
MKQKHLVSLLQKGFTTIQVQFPHGDPSEAPKVTMAMPPMAPTPWSEPHPTHRTAQQPRPRVFAFTYKAKLPAPAVGDQVLVDTSNQGLVVANVVGVDPVPRIDMDADFDYKWIVQRVDRTEYDAAVAQELAFADTLQAVEAEKQREEMVASFQARLPEGSAARSLFDRALLDMNGGQPPSPALVDNLARGVGESGAGFTEDGMAMK